MLRVKTFKLFLIVLTGEMSLGELKREFRISLSLKIDLI